MRQRVVIALALAASPKLIIADEPTTALDVSIQAQIIQLLKRLCRDHGTAVMLVTHDMGVIAETADRVAVMYAGRIVEIGPVADVIHRPAHPYTVGLMGSIPSIVDGARAPDADRRHDAAARRHPGRLRVPSALRPRGATAAGRERPELLAVGATARRVLARAGLMNEPVRRPLLDARPTSRARSTSRRRGSIACSSASRARCSRRSTASVSRSSAGETLGLVGESAAASRRSRG